MAVIFQSYFLQNKFQDLYKVLLVALNDCGACGIEKCFYCNKFDAGCVSCRSDRCRACVKFFNSINFFYIYSTKEQWDYLCNFLYDIFRLHDYTKRYFSDVSALIDFVKKDSFFVYSSTSNKTLMTSNRKKIYIL